MTLPPKTTQEPPLQPTLLASSGLSIHHHPKATMTEQPVGQHRTDLWFAYSLPPYIHQEYRHWADVGSLDDLPTCYHPKTSIREPTKGRCRPALRPCLLKPPKSYSCSRQWAIVGPLWFVHTPPPKSHHDGVASGLENLDTGAVPRLLTQYTYANLSI